VGPLGCGGMGEVYEVEHAALGRHFAVKLLHRSHLRRPDLAVRMREEARTLAALRHRNLVEVFDLGSTRDGRVYFAMEMLAGQDLRRELRRLGVLSVPAALDLVAQALDGLEVVHRAGVIHRDIKLENLFLCADGSLKILDFGIAKRGGFSVTGHGVLGTARSMAPEQHASGMVDARTDIYGMGLVLYELVAGRGPFDELRGRDHAMRYAHCERRPPPPSTFAPQEVPRLVEEAILKAIAKRPEQRFQSAAEMAAVLRDLKTESSAASRVLAPNALGIAAQPLMAAAAAFWSRRCAIVPSVAEAFGSVRGRIFPLRLKEP
jgi:serine/threonine protein kinase